MLEKNCAFTGHRPHKFPWRHNEEDCRCMALKTALTQQIIKLAKAGITDFYCGGADGVDCWAGWAVLKLREQVPTLRLHCILPYEGQADGWSDLSQERYRFILGQADSVEYVSREYRKDCMLERNHRLVEMADLILAVYNGERRGGTAATVRYARKLKKELLILHPLSLEVTKEKE